MHTETKQQKTLFSKIRRKYHQLQVLHDNKKKEWFSFIKSHVFHTEYSRYYHVKLLFKKVYSLACDILSKSSEWIITSKKLVKKVGF